ncbi:MAG: type II toxin-antitoxin system Phd/YefM family antitoxin [Leptospirales bacterium]
MATQWQLQEAKNRFSDVVKKALSQGPQTITLRGEPAVVVLSVREFRKLTEPVESLSVFFRSSPHYGVDLEIERDHEDLGQETSL